MLENPDAAIIAAGAVAIILAFFLGAVWAVQTLQKRRYERAPDSEAYQRAGSVQVLQGSPVAAKRGSSRESL